ncbi:MAG: rhomboid family intramembrane serine protease [Deinococcales bacterium]
MALSLLCLYSRGLLHFGMNMWVLADIGRIYERRRHWGNLLTSFVFGSIMGAYITSIAQAGDQLILVGASGGILGIAGALLADSWLDEKRRDPLLLRSLLQWMAIIVIFSISIPGVSLWGHVGGILGGLLWGFMRQGLPQDKNIDLGVGLISLGLTGYVLVMMVLFYQRYHGIFQQLIP